MGLERQPRRSEHILLLQRTLVLFLVPVSSNSQLPVIPALGGSLTSGLCWRLHGCAWAYAHTHS